VDQYIEQTVSCNRSGGRRAGYLLLCALTLVFLLIAAVCAASLLPQTSDGSLRINWIAAIGLIISLLLAFVAWRKKDALCVDYDYCFAGDTISVSAVYNSKRRKHLFDLELSNVRMCGSIETAVYKKIAAQSGVKIKKCCANQPLHFFLTGEGSASTLILLELDERMTEAIRRSRQLSYGAWHDTEGNKSSNAGLS